MAFAYPLSVTAHRTLPADDPDAHLFMWTLAWDAHAFIHQPLSIFDANIFYPNRDTLAYSENLIGSAFFAAPVIWLTGNPILAVNVVSLLSCALCGLGAYVLGRRVGLSVAASVIAGIVFAFSPPRFLRFSQLHLTAVQWIPFALASFHAYLDGGRRRDLLLAIACATLQVLASGHGGTFVILALLLLAIYRVALGEPVRLGQRLRDIGVLGAALVVPSVLFVIPYRHAQIDTGLRRTLVGWDTPLESFVASPTHVHVFLQSLFTERNINYWAGAFLFPGVLPLLLTAVAVVAGGVAIGRDRSSAGVTRRSRERFARRLALVSATIWVGLLATSRLLAAGDGLTIAHPDPDTVVQTGFVSIGDPAAYTLGVPANAAVRIDIDGVRMFDHAAGDARWTSRAIPLTRGAHEIRVESHQFVGSPPVWEWLREGDSGGYRPVPSWLLSQRSVGYGRAVAARVARLARSAAEVALAVALAWFAIVGVAGRRHGWSAWSARQRTSPLLFYVLLTAICIGLSLGPPYGLWQFVYWLPGLNFIRASSRFMVLGVLGIAVLAGFGADRLLNPLRRNTRLAAAVAMAGLMLAEFSVLPYAGVPFRLEIPAADRWLAHQPGSFAIAEVPVDRLPRYHTTYMLHSIAHWQKTVHGYSGIVPAAHEALYDRLRTFPDEDSLRDLTRLGVSRVVVHANMFSADDRRRLESRLTAFKDALTLEYSDADAMVYAIRGFRPD